MTPETEALMSKSLTALMQLNDAVISMGKIMQEIDRRDNKIMIHLRQQYALPQALAALSTSIGDNMAAFRLLFDSLNVS
jgi:hypothetical protein